MALRNRWLLLAVAWCVALNLRGISIGVSPILPLIQSDLALSYAQAGLLFAMPTVMMSLVGFPGGWMADTLGMKRTITLGLALILAGGSLRSASAGFAVLMLWTGLLGAGMGIANPGLTRLVKDRFSDMPGTVTGITTSGLITGATVASWLTYPYLVEWSGSLAWRGTFLFWSGLTCLTLIAWAWMVPPTDSAGFHPPRLAGLWRDRTVWKLNTIFLMQSFIFYSMTSWIPTYYHELGLSLKTGAQLLTAYIVTNLPSSLAIPFLSDRYGGRKWSVIVSCFILVPAMLGMMLAPMAAPWTYSIVMGLAMGGVFALAFALPLDYIAPAKVGSVAGMNLLVGYGGTFLGPLLLGAVHDLTGSFQAGWSVVVVALLVLIAAAWSLPKRVY